MVTGVNAGVGSAVAYRLPGLNTAQFNWNLNKMAPASDPQSPVSDMPDADDRTHTMSTKATVTHGEVPRINEHRRHRWSGRHE